MGAVVLEPQKKAGLLGVERHHIIDGQHRLTTLQYVLTTLVHTLRAAKHEKLLPLIEACLTNSNPETMEDESVERFKLWPTFRDRKQYEMAMTVGFVEALRDRFPSSFTQTGNLRKIGIDHPPALDAIMFFLDSMLDWVRDASEPEHGVSADDAEVAAYGRAAEGCLREVERPIATGGVMTRPIPERRELIFVPACAASVTPASSL